MIDSAPCCKPDLEIARKCSSRLEVTDITLDQSSVIQQLSCQKQQKISLNFGSTDYASIEVARELAGVVLNLLVEKQ